MDEIIDPVIDSDPEENILPAGMLEEDGESDDKDGNEQFTWNAANRLIKHINPKGDITQYAYDGDGNRVKMTIDYKHGPKGNNGNGNNNNGNNGNGNNGNGNNGNNGNGNGNANCHQVPPGFIPPGLAKKCGYGEEPFPDNRKGGPRDGWEQQHKKKHWEFYYTNDVTLELPEALQVTEADPTKWKETYVYGAGGERLSMTFLPANDDNDGWEPVPGTGGAEPGAISENTVLINRSSWKHHRTS